MADPIKETYNEATGLANVDENLFVPENDDSTVDDPSAQPENSTPESTQTPTQERKDTPSKPTDQPTAVDPEKPGNEPSPGKERTDDPQNQPRVYANKFKSEDELKKAYQNLGGNPDKFKSVEALEEAYEYRQGEYTRIQQEQAERDRLANMVPENTAGNTMPEDPKQTVDSMMAKVDWSKVENAEDLGKQLLTIFMENMPQNNQQIPTEAQLVERLMPLMQEREQKQKALTSLETEVPRLKTDQSFRKAFAYHVVGGRADGTKYPRTTEGLREAMKDFLAWGRSIAEEGARQNEINTQEKRGAIAPKEGGEGLPAQNQGDEMDDIIGAFAERQRKFNP